MARSADCVSFVYHIEVTGKYRIGVRERRSHAKGSNSHCAPTLLSPQVGYEVQQLIIITNIYKRARKFMT